MRDVSMVGVGQVPVGEHWDMSLRQLALGAIQAAQADAGIEQVDAVIVANALGGNLSGQNHLGALIAEYAGLPGVEAYRVEAADASGGVALRQGYLAVASGAADTVLVVGVEKATDRTGTERDTSLATVLDADFEAARGATPAGVAALLMQRYMYEYGVTLDQFEAFSVNAHANGALNPFAMYRNKLRPGAFAKAPVLAAPVNLFDSAPEGDGAAAVILTTTERALDAVPRPVRVRGSAMATDTLALHNRADLLFLRAVNLAAGRAYEQAGVRPGDVDMAELHDSYTILSALQLEAAGFAARGEGWKRAQEDGIGREGSLPVSTFGGLKARGNPLGATGVYQAVEIALQLRRVAGDNQVPNARLGLALSIGGIGSTAVAHILERVE
ncbi:thiolase domain-containing protein [Aggregatilinea lenta]|uniref:thiolase domain-containing protein n=1 Tax=Aggregatilinea lenta TaxID=913108 RepID=UPI000E5A63E3|nr:thiolase domain-containing protein [Aggregatilinea lenta]